MTSNTSNTLSDIPLTFKKCIQCRAHVDITNFVPSTRSKDGYTTKCIPCSGKRYCIECLKNKTYNIANHGYDTSYYGAVEGPDPTLNGIATVCFKHAAKGMMNLNFNCHFP